MKRILIVEDDLAIAEIERDFLEINGFDVTLIADGRAGYEAALKGGYDLILLDLMLPGMDGFEVCRGLRPQLDIPILMVTARLEDVDKIRGLGLGADDYISKPFSPSELVARVRANLNQYDRLKGSPNPQKGLIAIGTIALNPLTHEVAVGGKPVDIKNKEYELLHFFMQNPEIVFSKETLYERIWGMDAFGDIKTVAVHINRLREKIEKDPSSPQHLITVWGAGYRFKL